MSFSYVEENSSAKIKVIGVGGAGGNAVNNMIESRLTGVQFIVANTDAQALSTSRAEFKLQIGKELTQGLGAGADPKVGKEAALENAEEIKAALADSHMVFITAGLGGGTGTGAAPVVAEICKELGVLTVAVVSKPFAFEGRARIRKAEAGIEALRGITDTLITIPNDRLRGLASKGERMVDMMLKADEILNHSVKGISDLIMVPGLVNLDFADVKTIMSKAGMALMGIGIAEGDGRAMEAAERAISHPLLEDISISGARGVLLNITSSSSITLEEMTHASDRIHDEVGDDAEIIWGQTIDESMEDEIRITVIATGIGQEEGAEEVAPAMTAATRPRITTGVLRSPMDSPAAYAGQPVDPPARGTVRPFTDTDEIGEWQDDVRLVSNADSRNPRRNTTPAPAHDNVDVDPDDLDVPTFLRRPRD